MTDAELARFIRTEIRKQLDVILWGTAQGNQSEQSEDVGEVYPGMPTMTKRPLVEPYGLHGRAPQSTPLCVVRTGEDPNSRAVIGHLDNKRPTISQGETILYNAMGQQVYLQNGQIVVVHNGGKILLGSSDSNQPLVLGTVFTTMMNNLLTLLSTHTHECMPPGFPSLPPDQASDFEQIQASPIDDGTILSEHSFTER